MKIDSVLLIDGQKIGEEKGFQYLKIFDIEKGEETVIGKFYSLPGIKGLIRCDLHPRWEDENSVTFDSTHGGYRKSYMIKMERRLL